MVKCKSFCLNNSKLGFLRNTKARYQRLGRRHRLDEDWRQGATHHPAKYDARF